MPKVMPRGVHVESVGVVQMPRATINAHTQRTPTPQPVVQQISTSGSNPTPSTSPAAQDPAQVQSAPVGQVPVQPAAPQAPISQPSANPAPAAQVETKGAAPSEEIKAVTPPAKDPQPSADSQRFAALARREKQMRQEKADIEAREKAFQAREQTVRDEARAEVIKQLQQDTLGTLQQHGIDYNRITDSLLNQPTPEAKQIQELKQELAKLQKSQESTQTEYKNSQQRAYEQALNQVRTDVTSLVAKSDDYATIKTMGAEESVVELIKQTFDSDGVLLSVEDASKEVENYLVDEAIRLASIEKIRARVNPPTPKPEVVTQQPIPQQQNRTLTQSVAQVARKTPMTPEERRARAIAAFNGQLK